MNDPIFIPDPSPPDQLEMELDVGYDLFDQISDEDRDLLFQSVNDQSAKIRFLIDTYSSVWKDCSVRTILHFLQLDGCLDDFIGSGHRVTDAVYSTSLKLRYRDILLEIPYFEYLAIKGPDGELDPEKFKDHKFSSIRLHISGTGLNQLRQIGINCEEYFRVSPEDLDLPFHVTRVDIAFDFVNFKPEFIDQCFRFLDDPKKLTPSGRLAVVALPGGMSFKTVRGDQKTIYIGAPTSERYLRIYDKLLERTKSNGGVFNDLDFDGKTTGIKSWTRIEWQLRKEKAARILYSDDTGMDLSIFYLKILREIFEFYSFRDCELTSSRDDHIEVAEFWKTFFNWQEIEKLNQSVILYNKIDPLQKNKNFIEGIARKQLLTYVMLYKESGLLLFLRDAFNDLMQPKKDPVSEQIRKKKLSAFVKDLNNICGGDLNSFRSGMVDSNKKLIYPRNI